MGEFCTIKGELVYQSSLYEPTQGFDFQGRMMGCQLQFLNYPIGFLKARIGESACKSLKCGKGHL